MNNAQASSGKISWFTRIAYGLGDTALNKIRKLLKFKI